MYLGGLLPGLQQAPSDEYELYDEIVDVDSHLPSVIDDATVIHSSVLGNVVTFHEQIHEAVLDLGPVEYAPTKLSFCPTIVYSLWECSPICPLVFSAKRHALT